jgi:hypothetical protein
MVRARLAGDLAGMTSKRLAHGLLIGGVAAAGSMFPAVASATDYPVAPNSGQGFADALVQAGNHPGPDRILLGGGYYTAPDGNGFYYSSAEPIEIAGAGREGPGATIINAPSGGLRTLSLTGGSGSLIHDVRIDLPIGAGPGGTGLQMGGTARHIMVFAKDTQQSNGHVGMGLVGGTLEDSIVDVGMKLSSGVVLDDGASPSTIRDSLITADLPVMSSGGGLVERSRLLGGKWALQASRKTTTVRSSLLQAQSPTARGIFAYTSPGYDTQVVLNGVDVIGPGGPGTTGVHASPTVPGAKVSVSLANSIVRGFVAPLDASGDSKISASYSDYDGTGNQSANVGGITEAHISNVGAAGFVGPGDYRLTAASLLVDAGDPGAAQGLDLAGNPLVADSNGDGSARRDIGAYELPAPAPPPGGGQGADTRAPVLSHFASARRAFAKRTRFRFTLSEAARVTIRIQRVTGSGRHTRYRTVATVRRTGAAGRNSTAFSRKVGRRVLRAGRYRAVALATDAAHNRSAPRRAAFRIAR